MAVYERDGFTCQKCGDDSGGNLNAHHVEPHCANKELRWSVSNGITLCKTCHTQFHRRYGVKRCGRPELEEYLAAAEAVSRAKAAVRSNSR
jgi:5-methylcytosine-specific restriction endonuclease McrA